MLRVDTHKYNCSFYKERNGIVRSLYRKMLMGDSRGRMEAARAICREAELMATPRGRKRHPCAVCRHIARMRVAGIEAFMQNFKYENDF